MKKVITSSATSFKGPLLASLSPERERKRERTSRRGIIPISTLKHTCQLRGMDWGYAMLLSPNKDETIVHGCHCPGDMALRVCKVLDIPRSWYVCVNAEVGEDPGN